jgi:type II secretory pathway component PulF
MPSNEFISRPEKPFSSSPLQCLTEQVRRERKRENWFNIFKFVLGVFCLVLLVSGTTAVLRPSNTLTELSYENDAANDSQFFFEAISVFFWWTVCELSFVLVLALIALAVSFLTKFVIFFWSFILYFWAEMWTVRQRTLLTLLQTAAETNTPFAEIIRAYASGCYSSRFRSRLERFAAMLEQGHSLDEAIKRDPGLFRYDVICMLLGGNDPATLRSMESSINDERDSSPARSMSIIRVTYLFTILAVFFLAFFFIMFSIVPKFEETFKDFDTDLPFLTRQGISAANLFITYYYLSGPFVLLAATLFVVFFIVQTGVVVWRPPFLRRMFRDTDSAKLLRILSVGLKQNLPISRILPIYRSAVPSDYLRFKAFRVENDIEKGRSWTESLRRQRIVSAAEASLLETAERTGNLPAVLHQLSGSKERSQLRKDDLTSKLVFIPCILAFVAVVGVFVVAMFLPLTVLTNAMSQ